MEAKSEKGYKIHEKREFTGSVPNTKIIAFKKPYKEPPDYLLFRSARQNEIRANYQDYVNKHNYYQFVGINEYKNDCTMVRNVMRRRLLNRRKNFEELLEKKRERLANLLNSEMEMYHAEFETLFPTNEEKLNAFLKHVNELKRRKFDEQNRVANEMYEKRWKKNCDELRAKQRCLTYKACAVDNLKTVRLRNEFRATDDDDNKFLMNLMDKKMAAEETDRELVRQEKVAATRKASELNRQLAKEKLQQQEAEKKEALEEGRARFKEFQKEKAQQKIDGHKARLVQLENARNDLNKQVLLHEKKLAVDKEVQDIMNTKFLEEKALFEQREDEKQKNLRDQFMVAKQFAENIKKQEAEQEKKFEACVKKMMDAALKKTNDLLRKREEDQKTRIMDAKLQCDQLIAHKAMKASQGNEKKKEKEAMAAMAKETAEIAERNKQYLLQRARSHQTDLMAQIAYNEHLKSLTLAEKQRERSKMYAAEADYNARIKQALQDATIGSVHPMRVKALGSTGMK